MKKFILVGLIGCCFLFAGCSNNDDIYQTTTEISIPVGEELHIHASDFLNIDSAHDHDVEVDYSGVDTSTPGEYEVIAKYDGKEYVIKVVVGESDGLNENMSDDAASVDNNNKENFANGKENSFLNNIFNNIGNKDNNKGNKENSTSNDKGNKNIVGTVELVEGKEFHMEAVDLVRANIIDEEDTDKVVIDDSNVNMSKAGEYEIVITCDNEEYIVKAIVKKEPVVELNGVRVIYVTDINDIDYSQFISSVKNVDDYKVDLILYKKVAEINEITDKYISELENTKQSIPDDFSAHTNGIPEEKGVYNVIFSIGSEDSLSVYVDVYMVYK